MNTHITHRASTRKNSIENEPLFREATPVRSLTVAAGRTVLGRIHQFAPRAFLAEVYPSGRELGVFASQAEAALAIDEAYASEVLP